MNQNAKLMKPLYKYIPWIPEIYLILSVLFYWSNAGLIINPYAITLLLFLSLVIILKNRILGMTVSWIFLILSAYMVLALLSELSEFPEFNGNAWKMLGMGSVWLSLNLLLATRMLLKWYGKSLLFIDTRIAQTVG